MHTHPLFILFYCALSIATSSLSSAQTIKQKDQFAESLSVAWKSRSDQDFCGLYFTEGADQFQIDLMVSQWTAQRAYTPEATLTLNAIHTKSEIEAKARKEDQRTGTFSRLLRLLTPKVMNNHTYVPNLTPIGIAEIEVKAEGGGSIKHIPVGIDKDGKLRFCLMRITI